MTHAPVDWDGESHCTNECGNPATHRRIVAISSEGEDIYDLVCCQCALEAVDA
jgi:hypothetical protein